MIIIPRLQDMIHEKQERGLTGRMLSVFWVPPVGVQQEDGDPGGEW